MRTFGIESNGRLENTAVYYNGEQIAGVREIFLNLDENGTFDAVITYEGTDKKLYSKGIFTDYLENLKVRPPSFSEEEAQRLNLLLIDSDGDIENTTLTINDEPLDGVTELFLHIKSGKTGESAGGIKGLFGAEKQADPTTFRAEITYRYDDGTTETQGIFS